MIPPKEFTPAAQKVIKARSGGVCEACGVKRAEQIHHRLYKSRGGFGNPANGLHVCGLGNADGCHGIAHTAIGEQLGWSIRSGFDPAVVPVFHKAAQWWWRQTDDGLLIPVPAPDAMEYMTLIGAIKTGLAGVN